MNNKTIMRKKQKLRALKKQIDDINNEIYILQRATFNKLQAKFDFRKIKITNKK